MKHLSETPSVFVLTYVYFNASNNQVEIRKKKKKLFFSLDFLMSVTQASFMFLQILPLTTTVCI